MKLFFDTDATPEFIVEETLDESTGKSSKKYKIKGVFSTIGEKNRNGRIYPRNLWETEVSKYQENFNSGSINTLMEWEHPARTTVDPMEAVAKITSLNIKDKYVMGEAVLLDNTKANQIKTLIDNGVKISVSSRGVGSVKNGIVESFKLTTYDLVATPSDYNATMNGLVESHQLNEGIIEDLTFGLDAHGNIVPLSESVCDTDCGCQSFEKEEIQGAIMEKFKEFLNSKQEVNEGKVEDIKNKQAKLKAIGLNLAKKFQSDIETELSKIYSEDYETGSEVGLIIRELMNQVNMHIIDKQKLK